MSFHKRRFQGPTQLVSQLAGILARPRVFGELVIGRGALDPQLREKVMLAVTSVNQCRYCSFVHTLLALKEGHSYAEIQELLTGSVDHIAEDEREALLFAQHWADTQGNPDPEAREKLVETYGEEKTVAIESAIRAIMFGNYFGNTVDYALHTLSGGRLASRD